MADAVQAFVDAAAQLELSPTEDSELIVCHFIPAVGDLAGTSVQVGVAVDELQSWPQVPPYWVHLPGDISFAENGAIRESPKEGWRRHSRQISNWGNAPPAADWSSHIHAVLKVATR